jgi:hypothetical protein
MLTIVKALIREFSVRDHLRDIFLANTDVYLYSLQ